MIPELIEKLPVLDKENLPLIMDERIYATKNDITSVPILWQGILEMNIQMESCRRTVKLYVPRNTPQGTSFILMNCPDGESVCEFIRSSRWIDFADRNGVCLCVTEPAGEKWMSPDEEYLYFSDCLDALFNGKYIRGGMSVYIVGYGNVGKSLHQLTMSTPLRVAAACFFNASSILGDLSEIESTSLTYYGKEFDLCLRDIPVPVYLLYNKTAPVPRNITDHWRNSIGNTTPALESETICRYIQQRECVCTPEGNIAEVVIEMTDDTFSSPNVTEKIGNFLLKYSRFGKAGPYGNSLVLRPNYSSNGVEFRYFYDENGNRRECLIYVPMKCRSKSGNPMVLALHGSCESVRNYFEESQWYRKADQEGFILVIPEGLLKPVPDVLTGGEAKAYRSLWDNCETEEKHSDIGFIEKILDRMLADYSVDKGRIYCTGHSMGCMMANYVGSSRVGNRFAALAGTSGCLDNWDDKCTHKVPVFMTMGEFDLWPGELSETSLLTDALDLWLIRNLNAERRNVSRVRTKGVSSKYDDGRYECYIWKNKQGIPMVRYEYVHGKDHMNTPGENKRFWDLWFSKWSINESGKRVYEGKTAE